MASRLYFTLYKNFVVILLFVFFSSLQLTAQSFDEKNFSLYTTKDGLTDNRVSCLTQDAYGYMWISTEKGLNRFDGNSFLKFYSDSSRNSLPTDVILKMKWLNKEQLGILTTGLHIINTRTLQSRNLIIPPDSLKYEYKVNNVRDVFADPKGNIFILTGSGFYQYNYKDELVFRFDYFKKDQAETEAFQFGVGLAMPEKNILLVSTINGLYIYNSSNKELHHITNGDNDFYKQISRLDQRFEFKHSDSHSFSIFTANLAELFYFDLRDRTKHLVKAPFKTSDKFSWRSRLFRLNDTAWAITGKEKGFYLIHYNRQENSFAIQPALYFENYFCSSLFVDKKNQLWIGTNKGLFREKRTAGNIEKIIIPAGINPFNRDLNIRMITIANNKVFAASNGEGLFAFEQAEMKPLKKIDFSKYGKLANNIYSTITKNEDTIFAGANGALAWVNTHNYTHDKVNLPGWETGNDWVGSMFKDSRNKFYVCSGRGNEFYYRSPDEKEFKLSNHINNPLFNILTPRYITEDPEGNLWFSGHGTSRFNNSSQQFDKLLDSFPKIRTARREVLGLVFDKNGKMYFGLPENGLIIYNPLQKKFEQITRTDGLPDNFIRAIYLHGNKLWLGTESGLASYDIQSKKISSFGIVDDMPADPFTAHSFYYDSLRKQLYGAFNNTIVRFDPDKLTKNNSPPDFFIESIVVTEDKIFYHPGEKIELSYKHNNIVVNLAAINFEDAYQQHFAYRFVKENEPWQEIGSQRNIILRNLSPGTHHLQLKVFIKNNSWPQQVKEITIYIHPPFWQTTWFIVLAVVLILLSLFGLYKFRVKNIQKKANIDKQLAELEIKGLHAQMNPHFIFNSLNSIKEMILENEKQNASRYLSKFAQLIRSSLEQSRQTFITVKQCIDHLQQYLEMEKIRFEGFSYIIDADENLPDNTLIAPMLIQPLTENAIWHGLQNQTGEKKLQIHFYKSGTQLICEIEDNGIGMHQSIKNKAGLKPAHRSLGIQNIHERLRVLNEKYHMNSSLSITDKSELPGKTGTGTLVVLKFNI